MNEKGEELDFILNRLEQQEISFHLLNGIAFIGLKREKALNALSLNMINHIGNIIHESAQSDKTHAAMISSHAAPRVFCSGGDIKYIYYILTDEKISQEERLKKVRHYIMRQYDLHHLLYESPNNFTIMSYVDGICFGGGAGLAINPNITIISENAVFAMPECAIGFFPDARSAYFLNKAPGAFGMYCALTGARIHANDMYDMGLAEYFIPTDHYYQLREALLHINWTDWDVNDILDIVISRFHVTPPIGIYRERLDWINERFYCHDFDVLIDNLKSDQKSRKKSIKSWANEAMDMINKGSPYSLRRTFEYFNITAAVKDFAFAANERAMFEKMIIHPDVITGIKAALIDKNKNPRWKRLLKKDKEDKIKEYG